MPALAFILSNQTFRQDVLPLYLDLLNDKDYKIRVASAKALPKLCELFGRQNACDVFAQTFLNILKDPNPYVIQALLTNINFDLILPKDLSVFQQRWV